MGKHERRRLFNQWVILNGGATALMYSPGIIKAAKKINPFDKDEPPPSTPGGSSGTTSVTPSSAETGTNEFALLDWPYDVSLLITIAVVSGLLLSGPKRTTVSTP